MKKIILTVCVLIFTVCLMVACSDAEVTTQNVTTTVLPNTTDTSVVTTQPATTEPPVTTEPIGEAQDIVLHFTDAYVCSSKFDPKSGGQEGSLVHWDRWHSTDYIDVTDYYGLFYELGSHKYLMSLSFYTEGKEYISGVGTTSTSDAAVINGFVTIPEGTTYIRAITFTGIASHNATYSAKIKGYANERDYEAACKAYPYQSLVVACIGDSLTEGDIGCFTPGVPDRKFKNYPYYLGKELGCSVLNYGKCGYTAEMILNSYRQNLIDITKADVILIMLGTNAGLKTNGVTQYNAYLLLLDLIRADMKEGAKLILITPPYAARSLGSVYQCVEEAAKTVLEIAKQESLDVIDAHNNSPIQEETQTLYQPNDGLHMVEGGYEVYAHYIVGELLKILEK